MSRVGKVPVTIPSGVINLAFGSFAGCANLAEVYFDAVFHPLLTLETFEREGHHLAPADPAQPTGELKVTGIVYNEMKGAFSHPESRYFPLGRIGRDQLGDYAARKGWPLEKAEKWLSPNLGYDV